MARQCKIFDFQHLLHFILGTEVSLINIFELLFLYKECIQGGQCLSTYFDFETITVDYNLYMYPKLNLLIFSKISH